MVSILIRRLLIGYALAHILLGLFLLKIDQGCSPQEHGLALGFGLIGLTMCLLFFIAAKGIYARRWVKIIFNLMIIGDMIKVFPIAIPISLFTAIVLCSDIANSGNSLWSLLSIVGVITGATIAQLHLTSLDEDEEIREDEES